MRSLFLPITSPMNAPAVKQIMRLVMAKKPLPIELVICGSNPVAFKESTIATQMRKPMIDAPAKMKVALLVAGMVDGLNLRYPEKPISDRTVASKIPIAAAATFIKYP